MNPSQHWIQLVNQTMSQRPCSHSQAWLITGRAHPDAAALMSAFGRSRQTVSFFNSRRARQVTPEKQEAEKSFSKFVNERMRNGLSYGQAYNAVFRDHPDLEAKMYGSGTAQFVNSNDGNPPAATSDIKKLFWLPPHATQDQFEAAYKGNGSTLTPLNPGKIFAALVELTQKQRGIEYDPAIAQTKAAFPDLWNAVELLAKEPV